jgi:AbiV family abortive infection protein
MAGARKRRLPTSDEARRGIPVVLANAEQHLAAADLLVDATGGGNVGFAAAHLVLAIEEAEKARTLGQIALGDELTEKEVRERLFNHPARHRGALTKSWSSGAAMMDFLAEGLRERLGMGPSRSEEARWTDVMARHPEVLPPDWPDTAGEVREGGMYADMDDDGTWRDPDGVDRAVYDQLRVAAAQLLAHHWAAYRREIELPTVVAVPHQIASR